jgi:N utilization substance protein A
MFDLKVLNAVLNELEEERGIQRDRMLETIEQSLATAYKKEFGKRGQIITANVDLDTGTTAFQQIKVVVDESMLHDENEPVETEETDTPTDPETPKKVRFDEEKHIMLDTARMIKKDAIAGEELVFPLEEKADFGRIAAQTAKQVIVQKIREAEKESALTEYGQKEGDIVVGQVQRFERGNLYVDLGRVTAVMPSDEQIPGERFRPGERIRALLVRVEETNRGIFLRLSRAHPDFLAALFTVEAPELQSGTVEVKAVAREAGARSKIAVLAHDNHIDPVGSMVGQRGARVSTVMGELGGEKIDIIEWSDDPIDFIEDALSPAEVLDIKIEADPDPERNERGHAIAEVTAEQQSLAIGRGGQNVRLAAKLTGWKIDIVSTQGDALAEADASGAVEITAAEDTVVGNDLATLEDDEGTTTKPDAAAVLDDAAETKDRDAYGPNETNPVDTPEETEQQVNEADAADEIVTDEATNADTSDTPAEFETDSTSASDEPATENATVDGDERSSEKTK